MALKYKRILLKLSGEVLKGSSASCHDETILAEVAQPFDAREAIRLMGQGTVALFAGDTGNPFFSTDSGAALRAAEIGADALLKATKVDGIYSADPATGRIAESDGFAWDYLAGSNLKSKLTYPNDAVVTWTYEPHRDLLTAVTNSLPNGTTLSAYVYTNDLLGRRTSKNDEQYGYNVRDELISADEVSYNYDDIGNRTIAEGKTYTANNLNQYTAIDDFVPQYDADGNQTLIKTETGVWSVVYNAENRPVRWTQGDTVITMAFDRMGPASRGWMPRRGTPCGRSLCGTPQSPSPRGPWPCAPRTGDSTSSIRTTATRTSRRSSTTPRRTASPRTTTTPPSAPSPPQAPAPLPIPSASPPNSTTTPSPSSTTTTATTTPKTEGGWEEICVKLITNIVFWGIMGIPREIFLDYMMKKFIIILFLAFSFKWDTWRKKLK